MITLSQWRCAIGVFTHPRSGRLHEETTIPCTKFQDYTLCARLCALSIALWALCLTQFCLQLDVLSCFATSSDVVCDCVISQHRSMTGVCRPDSPYLIQPLVLASSTPDSITTSESLATFFFSSLLRDGDVESHPGPGPFTLEELSGKFEDLLSEFKELRKDISNLRNDLNDLKMDTESSQRDINTCFKYCDDNDRQQKDHYKELHEQQERQEIYSRRENIILKNITEDENEDVSDKVINLLNSVDTDKTWKKEQFQRVHRLGKKMGDRSRVIIARFISFQDKLKVLGLRQKLVDKNVKVTNDLTRDQRQTLADLNARGVTAYYKGVG